MRVDIGSGSGDLGFLIMRLHAITPWSDKPSVISSSEYPLSKEQVITARDWLVILLVRNYGS